MGSFSGRRRIGCPRSLESQRLERLDTFLGHWPEVVQEKQDCVVCSKVRGKRGLTRCQYRHGSRVICSACKVHLCVTSERDCFKKYHTLHNYWSQATHLCSISHVLAELHCAPLYIPCFTAVFLSVHTHMQVGGLGGGVFTAALCAGSRLQGGYPMKQLISN